MFFRWWLSIDGGYRIRSHILNKQTNKMQQSKAGISSQKITFVIFGSQMYLPLITASSPEWSPCSVLLHKTNFWSSIWGSRTYMQCPWNVLMMCYKRLANAQLEFSGCILWEMFFQITWGIPWTEEKGLKYRKLKSIINICYSDPEKIIWMKDIQSV